MRTSLLISIAAVAAIALPAAARAQDPAGLVEYQKACASCHGESGKGDGPVSTYLNVPVPNLTRITARNNGTFPFQDLLEMIDGRNKDRRIGAHGISMPVWGDRFMIQSGSAEDTENEINTLGRITSLVYYLSSIQE